MKIVEAAKKAIRVFRIATAPLDWLECGAFVLVAFGVAGLILWAFLATAVDGIKEQDWLKAIASLIPLFLLAFAAVKSALTQTLNWILVVFVVLVSGVAFYFIYC
jgi:hypothetical protein